MKEIMISDKVFPVIELAGRPKAILDCTVADIYEVETKEINQAVANNPQKFPEEFMFQLTGDEKELVKNFDRFNNLKHSSAMPKAFTWEGCNMLATILKSDVAVKRAIQIVRGFTMIEKIASDEKRNGNKMDFMSSEFEAAIRLAKLFGLSGNQAVLAANRGMRNLYEIDPQQTLQIELKNEKQEKLYTATEIGKMMSPNMSPNNVNVSLHLCGLIDDERDTKNRLTWKLTEIGKKFGQYLDTEKKSKKGVPVQQIKWYESVLEVLKEKIK